MGVRMLFVVGAPRSGTTMLERMLASHSMVLGGPEPHLLTPLAHLGVWSNVAKAPYDHVLAAEAQREFVAGLPRGEQDYWDACRAYCDVLYGRQLAAHGGGRTVCMDKTPAYALILPFLAKVFPDATYIVLTRHPLAVFSSFADSFFDGDYRVAHEHNPLLERYGPALAAVLRQDAVPRLHVRYEDLVQDPETWFERICSHAGLPFEPQAIDYGAGGRRAPDRGLGDPIGVRQHSRPSTASLDKWSAEVAADPAKRALLTRIVAALDPADLRTLGYDPDTLFDPVVAAAARGERPKVPKLTRYRLERKAIIALRAQARKGGPLRRALERLRLTCDVLLRE
jgi:hypothetical protein